MTQPTLTIAATVFTIKLGGQVLVWTGKGMYHTVKWALEGNYENKPITEEEWQELVKTGDG